MSRRIEWVGDQREKKEKRWHYSEADDGLTTYSSDYCTFRFSSTWSDYLRRKLGGAKTKQWRENGFAIRASERRRPLRECSSCTRIFSATAWPAIWLVCTASHSQTSPEPYARAISPFSLGCMATLSHGNIWHMHSKESLIFYKI